MAGITQRRLMKEFGIGTDSVPTPQLASSKKVPPAVAPKPSYAYSQDITSPSHYAGGDNFHTKTKLNYSSATYQNTSDFPPPPPSLLTNPVVEGNSYQDYGKSPDANRYNPSLQRASPQPVPMSYQTTSNRPTYFYGSQPTSTQPTPRSNQPAPQRPSAPSKYSYDATPQKNSPSSAPLQSHTGQMSSSSRPTGGAPVLASHPSAPSASRQKTATEAEVDALTNLLIQNMEASSEPGFYGMCTKCKCSIIGEVNGCTAMDNVYHVDCFTCTACNRKLKGLPFFAVESEPYCEPCYLNTLEKCSVCAVPITDRILRATGKPYHPECFTCVVCKKSLDGIPFTVDATNKVHCIDDFHKKFAPRCCVCILPIMPEDGQEETVRVVAMDRSFHVHCYKCEDCSMVLSSEAEGRGCYPLDNHILCKNCNTNRIQAMTHQMTTEL